jgi:hypothetical protein
MCQTVTRRRCGRQLADLLRYRRSRDPLLSISCEPCQPELAETRSESPIASTTATRAESRYQRGATRVRTSAPFRFPLRKHLTANEVDADPTILRQGTAERQKKRNRSGQRAGTAKMRFEGPFAGRTIAMLDSPAYRVLSLSAHRILAQLRS